jgi:hypothetical protein
MMIESRSHKILSENGVGFLLFFAVKIFLFLFILLLQLLAIAAVEDNVHDAGYEEHDGCNPGQNFVVRQKPEGYRG